MNVGINLRYSRAYQCNRRAFHKTSLEGLTNRLFDELLQSDELNKQRAYNSVLWINDCGKIYTVTTGTQFQRLRDKSKLLENAACIADELSVRKTAAVVVGVQCGTHETCDEVLEQATGATLTEALLPTPGTEAVLSTDGNVAYCTEDDNFKVESGCLVAQCHGKGGNAP